MNRDVTPAGASAIVTLNYGSDHFGTAGAATNDIAEAVAWLKYADVTNHWNVQYWEVGNEQYGNSYYTNVNPNFDWEVDLHKDRSPMAYGSNVVLFSQAMKAAVPGIKIGAVMQSPGSFPDSDVTHPYNQCVLTNCGNAIDFVIIHWYPGGSASQILTRPRTQIAGLVESVRNQLTNYLGAARATQLGIAITETDAGTNTGIVEALYCADDYLTWFENGIFNMDWQELLRFSPTNNDGMFLDYPSAPYTNQQPCAPYCGATMAHLLANVGDQLVSATSSATSLRVHAALRQDGKVGLMLQNQSSSASQTANVTITGASLGAIGVAYEFSATNFTGNPTPTYPVSSNSISGLGNTFSLAVPAYTMVDLLIPVVTNTPPVLTAMSNWTVNVGQTVAFTADATDTDSPPQTLTFSLLSGPAAATLTQINNTNANFNWRPSVPDADTTNLIALRVADNGSPPLSATQAFKVTVNALNPPVLAPASFSGGLFSLQVTGALGPDYEIQRSSNLVDWAAAFTTNSPGLPFVWGDTNAATVPAQFYRVKVGPPLP